jgi:hypothetical protein
VEVEAEVKVEVEVEVGERTASPQNPNQPQHKCRWADG